MAMRSSLPHARHTDTEPRTERLWPAVGDTAADAGGPTASGAMGEGEFVSCFGLRRSPSDKHSARGGKAPDVGNISPQSSLSSVASEQAIKALRPGGVKGKKVNLLADLAQERMHRQNLEEQLSTALGVNEELKLAVSLAKEEGPRAAMQQNLQLANGMVIQERKEKENLAAQLAAAKRESGALRAALNAARVQRDDLEAELMEAALDVMNNHKLQTDHEVLVRNENAAKEAAEAAAAEAESLRHQLRVSEEARETAERRLREMDLDAHDWEMALDTLQERLEDALTKRPGLESIAVGPMMNYSNYMPDTPSPVQQCSAGQSSLCPDVLLNDELDSFRASDSYRNTSSSISMQSDVEVQSDEEPAVKPEPWRQVVVQPRQSFPA